MVITRRAFVDAALASGVAVLTGPFSPGALSAQTRTRFSASSPQGKAMLVKYAKAVGIMQDAERFPKTDARSWTFQWYTHWIPGSQSWVPSQTIKRQMITDTFARRAADDPDRVLATAMWDTCQAHSANPQDKSEFQRQYFCPWHRGYVYRFEDIVRGVLKDPAFTLPYWDYLSGNLADLSIPPEFRDVASPLFHPKRNDWVNRGERIDRNNPGILNRKALDEPGYIDATSSIGFCPSVDNNPHGFVHGFVGGLDNMGTVPTAAGDPLFWLHHCEIDRLWESWNRLAGRNNPAWAEPRTFTFADAQGKLTTIAPASVNRVADLDYDYDTYLLPSAPPRRIGSLTTLTKASSQDSITMSSGTGSVELKPSLRDSVSQRPFSTDEVFATADRSRSLYVTLTNIMASAASDAMYNVFLNLPEPISGNVTSQSPNYIGTMSLFGADGHSDEGHTISFNITDRAPRLALSKQPLRVTLRRAGGGGASELTIGAISLVER